MSLLWRLMLKAALFFLLLPVITLSADIVGNYSVEGNDPLGSSYSGTATISKAARIYTAWWYYQDGTSDMGTGIVTQNQISFIYRGSQTPRESGIITYQIENDQLVGRWIAIGATTVGTETMRRH